MSYIVRIPEPCHEDWNKMTVDEKGRFCNVCSKSVVDFTSKTDTEIHSILIKKSAEKVCGRFNKNQVERPIETQYYPINTSSGFRKVFLAAAFLVFGTFLFSCKDDSGNFMGEPEVQVMGAVPHEEVKPLKLEEVKMDSVQESQIITLEQNMIAGGLSYDYVPQFVMDSVPEIVIADTMNYVTPNYNMTGSVVYVREDVIIDEDSKEINEEIKNQISQKQFNIFPNPSNGAFTIEYELRSQTAVEIAVFDMTGSLVKQIVKPMKQQSGIYQMPINLTELPSGIYICRIVKDGKEEHKELVIAK
jgi:hypothetical protein